MKFFIRGFERKQRILNIEIERKDEKTEIFNTEKTEKSQRTQRFFNTED